MDTGEILRTVLNHDMPNASIPQNVFHHIYIGPGAPDQDIVNSVNAWILTEWGDAWAELAAATVEIESFQCDVVNLDGTVARNLGGLLVNVPGGLPGSFNAAATSGYLLGYTEEPKQRGSKYAVGMSESVIDDNLFDGVALGNLALLLGIYLAPISVAGSDDLISGILSRTLLQFVQFNGNGLIDSQPAYQRRRKFGVGL